MARQCIISQYTALYEYVNDKIGDNLKGLDNPVEWVECAGDPFGKSAYYHRVRCYYGLCPIEYKHDKNKQEKQYGYQNHYP